MSLDSFALEGDESALGETMGGWSQSGFFDRGYPKDPRIRGREDSPPPNLSFLLPFPTFTTMMSKPRQQQQPDRKRKNNTHNSAPTSNKKKNSKITTTTQTPQHHPRRHAEIVSSGKRLWNQLRQKNLTDTERRVLLDDLVPLVLNNKTNDDSIAAQVALQHDGSRLVQAIVQFGSPTERTRLVEALTEGVSRNKGNVIVELCQSQYAHFCILKLLRYGSAADCDVIYRALQGHWAHLFVHATASRVVEAVWRQPNHSSCYNRLWSELYGPHCSLWYANQQQQQQKRPTLASSLQAQPSTKRDITLSFCQSLIDKAIAKSNGTGSNSSILGYSYFHAYLWEFLLQQQPTTTLQHYSSTLSPWTLSFLASAPGADVVAVLATYGTAKDRKHMAKACKGHVASAVLEHPWAYRGLFRLIQVTDDTVCIYKNVLAELVNSNSSNNSNVLLSMALSGTASKLLRWLLSDGDASATTPKESSTTNDNSIVSTERDTLDGPVVLGVTPSKKDATVRRRELLERYLLEPLMAMGTEHARALCESISGGQVLVGMVVQQEQAQVQLLLEAVAECTDADLLEHAVGHRTVQALLKAERKKKEADASTTMVLADALVRKYQESQYAPFLASNRGAFVLDTLMGERVLQHSGLTRPQVSAAKNQAQKSGSSSTAGYDALLGKLGAKKGSKE